MYFYVFLLRQLRLFRWEYVRNLKPWLALKAAIGTCSHDKEAALPSEKFTKVFRYKYRAYIVFRKEEGEVGLCGYGPLFPACRHTHERGNVLGLFVGASLYSALESVLGLLAGSSRPQHNGCSREQGQLASVLTPTEGPRRVQNSKVGAGSNSPAWTPLPQGLVPAHEYWFGSEDVVGVWVCLGSQ